MGSQSPPNALNGRWHPWAEPRLDQHLLAGILLELGGRGGGGALPRWTMLLASQAGSKMPVWVVQGS